MTSPLQGLKIIEMGTFGPATYGMFMLGDLGADVIRIKPPPHPSRAKAGTAETDEDGTPIPPGGVAWHRNKRELTLNLRSPEAQEVFYKLARQADVVVEANRPGVLDRLGIGYERMREINPRIIYCSVTGYGQEGPYRLHPGHDTCWAGRGGSLYLTGMSLGNLGNRRETPDVPQRLISHHAASHYTAIAILAALNALAVTGRGQHIDVSNCDSVVGVAYEPADAFLTGLSPAWNLYETKDGRYLAVGARDHHTWSNLCRALGKDAWVSRLTDQSSWAGTLAELRDILKGRTRDEWWEFFQHKATAVAPVLTLDEVGDDPQVKQRQMLVELDLPNGGTTVHGGIAMKLRGTPGRIRTLPPTENQHTDEVLKELGYDEAGIQSLRAADAVR